MKTACVYKSPQFDSVLKQMNPVHILTFISLRFILIISFRPYRGLQSSLFLSSVATNILYARLISLCVLHVPPSTINIIGLSPVLGGDDDFSFSKGWITTSRSQIKNLEFSRANWIFVQRRTRCSQSCTTVLLSFNHSFRLFAVNLITSFKSLTLLHASRI
jgi:hypothetical protein